VREREREEGREGGSEREPKVVQSCPPLLKGSIIQPFLRNGIFRMA